MTRGAPAGRVGISNDATLSEKSSAVSIAMIADVENRLPDLILPAGALPRSKGPPNLRAEAAASEGLSRILATDPSLLPRWHGGPEPAQIDSSR